MKYWERFIASAWFLLALPSIIYETIRYRDTKISSLKDDFIFNVECFWFYIKTQLEK